MVFYLLISSHWTSQWILVFTALLKTFCLCLMCNNQLCVIEYQVMPLFRSINLYHVHYRQHFLRGIINLVLRAFLGYPWLPQICSKNATVRRTHSSSYTRVVRLNVARARTFLCFRAPGKHWKPEIGENNPRDNGGMTSRDALLLL